MVLWLAKAEVPLGQWLLCLTTIINRKGFNLPTTGGFGTLLFSGIGVLLVVAGVGVLLSLKKKNRA